MTNLNDKRLDQLKTDQQNKKKKYGTDNPCQKEQELSFKCLEDNFNDKESCQIYFDNYKTCKRFWAQVQTRRRIQGIKPTLPDFEEREKIKADYLKNH